jgi:hypothetical protein
MNFKDVFEGKPPFMVLTPGPRIMDPEEVAHRAYKTVPPNDDIKYEIGGDKRKSHQITQVIMDKRKAEAKKRLRSLLYVAGGTEA